MTSFFGGNPFTSAVGQKIEQATDASLASENWALNMEICDIINETEDGPKDAIKAIRKRLAQNAGKNYTVVMYTLTVLETCVKNCGKRFHILACSKEFVQDLVKLIGPKNDPPTAVQEKVLSLIQSWADAFQHQADLLGVVQVCNDLKQKGIEFPMTDLDTMAPIHTPQRSIPDADMMMASNTVPVPIPSPVSASPQKVPPGSPASQVSITGPTSLTSDQLGKLQSELDVVQGNMMVLNEMLTELTPGKEHPSDLELLQELYATCHTMQQRLVELIGKLSNDEITAELLRINDELNNLFLRYSRFQNNREPSKNVAASDKVPPVEMAADSLIDLTDAAPAEEATEVSNVTSKLSDLGLAAATATSQLSTINSVPALKGSQKEVTNEKEDSEFDMFAQSRNVSYETTKTGGSSYKDNLEPNQVSGALGAIAQNRSQPVMHRESDFDEIAAWLNEKPTSGSNDTEETLTSSEFERFLAERAAAAESLPTVTSSSTNVTSSSSRSHHHRPMKKEPDAESSLFAL